MALSEQQQVQMCGETFEQLRKGFLNHNFGPSKVIYVMGFLSDAQEMMAHGNVEGARQILNGAKFLMSEYFMEQR